jgi:hypothetical protein
MTLVVDLCCTVTLAHITRSGTKKQSVLPRTRLLLAPQDSSRFRGKEPVGIEVRWAANPGALIEIGWRVTATRCRELMKVNRNDQYRLGEGTRDGISPGEHCRRSNQE